MSTSSVRSSGAHCQWSATYTLNGLRLLMIGDPLQLRPVEGRYFFKARTWGELEREGMALAELTTVFRQSDPQLPRLLSDARYGTISPESRAEAASSREYRTASWHSR